MAGRIVALRQTIYLILGVAIGVMSITLVNSLFLNYQKGLELALLGTIPNVKISLENAGVSSDQIIKGLKEFSEVEAINEVLTIRGTARAYGLKQEEGAFGFKRDTEFTMHGLKISDTGYYIEKYLDKNVSQDQRNVFNSKIHQGLSAYRVVFEKFIDSPEQHEKFCSAPLEGRQYKISDVDQLIGKKNFDEKDIAKLKLMERCIAASVDFKFAFAIMDIIMERSDITSLAYSGRNILINEGFAGSLFSRPSGKIRFEFNAIEDATNFPNIPERVYFTNGGIFRKGFMGGNDATIFISLDKMAELLGIKSKANELFVRLKDPYAAKEFSQKLNNKWKGQIHVSDWISENKAVFTFLLFLKTLILTILSMIILVSSFGLAAQLYMTVFEKERHIAVLKSIGATPPDILSIFFLYSFFVGFWGWALGLVGGYMACIYSTNIQGEWISKIFNTEKLSINISSLEMFYLLTFVLMVCLLAAYFPAKKASETNPIHGLNT